MPTPRQMLLTNRQGRLPESELVQVVREVGRSSDINDASVQGELARLLSHSSPLVRYEALAALGYRGLSFDWSGDLGQQVLAGIDVVLNFDEDQDCRRQAASVLGSLFKSTKNPETINALAMVCEKKTESDDVRAFAYDAILAVLEVQLGNRPDPVGRRLGRREMEHIEQLVREYPRAPRD